MSILRKYETKNGCELCGEFHVLSYGGLYYCQDRSHPAHLSDMPPLPPMTEEELLDLHLEIVANKNRDYPGGYEKWITDNGIKRKAYEH